ncbi:uncharacterized protein LOC141912760 isoform X2 [Tubulanus polymorphus]|uniref:uncharacterized protein LOC141912760 isoform X2 n=1 Tax=Tubulanus polymorphus TaxID=672921 RepID=UPI003DA25EA0
MASTLAMSCPAETPKGSELKYTADIDILDRGDAPAKAVIVKNERNLAQRAADETREELHKVMKRVDHIYGTFELQTQLGGVTRGNMEYISDIGQLEDIIKDNVKKKKYQQQVTIFIVGYENICTKKLQLLQQINEFFMENGNKLEDDDTAYTTSPDVDMDDVSNAIEESIEYTEILIHRVGQINKDIVECLANYAQNKAGSKGRRKLEKALQQTKDELASLSERLMTAQTEVDQKEEKIQQMFKQLDMKNMECQRYKSAAEAAKKGVEDSVQARNQKEDKIRTLQRTIDEIQFDNVQAAQEREQNISKLLKEKQETQNAIVELENQAVFQTMQTEHQRRDLVLMHEHQVDQLKSEHKKVVTEVKDSYQKEILQLNDEIDDLRQELETVKGVAPTDNTDQIKKRAARQKGKGKLRVKLAPNSRMKSRELLKDVGKPATKQVSKRRAPLTTSRQNTQTSIKSSKTDVNYDLSRDVTGMSLDTVRESNKIVVELDNFFDLDAEESWASVPADQIEARFKQYRELSQEKISELEMKLDDVLIKTQKKVNTLKAQFQEHKSRWEAERKALIKQIDQASNLQNQAEQEADACMAQLEEFIREQEQLEGLLSSELSQSPEQLDQQQQQLSVEEASGNNLQRKAVEQGVQATTPPVLLTKRTPTPAISQQQHIASHTNNSSRNASPDAAPEDGDDDEDDDDEVNRNVEATNRINDASSSRLDSVSASADEALTDDLNNSAQEEGTVAPQVVSSARSRASVRGKYKEKLEETRSAIEERRSKSPAVSLKSLKSTIIDAEVNENGDVPFPIDKRVSELRVEAMMQDASTSPLKFESSVTNLSRQTTFDRTTTDVRDHTMVLSDDDDDRKSTKMVEHPVVQEYLRSYGGIIKLKDDMSALLKERGMPVSNQMLLGAQTVTFDEDDTVQPQLEEMSVSILKILDEIFATFSDVLDELQKEVSEPVEPARDIITETKMSAQIKDLQEQIIKVQGNLESEKQKYESQIQINTTTIMEMQETINRLKLELTDLHKRQEPVHVPDEEPVMFTRLDYERNAKTMKRAVVDKKLEPEKYVDACEKMQEYVSIPAQRFTQLVRKFYHHCQMKEIEENVRQSRSLNDNVFQLLDKMEQLQNKRAQRWTDEMDTMDERRILLAKMLMDTLDNVEEESGIFLIKPVYSFKGRGYLDAYATKIERMKPPKAPAVSPIKDNVTVIHQLTARQGSAGIHGEHVTSIGDTDGQVWQTQESIPRVLTADNLKQQQTSYLNTPRILELDINRMMIGQNTISAKIPAGPLSDDRLVNASNANLRSYMTVNRPSGTPGGQQKKRLASGSIISEKVPPSTPYGSEKQKRPRSIPPVEGFDISTTIPSASPLPPIAKESSKDAPFPPESPPGSSLQTSPPPYHQGSNLSPVMKVVTRSPTSQTVRSLNVET